MKNQKLLVIAPHPDDEVIGAGGLIKRVKYEGGRVYVLFLTVGDTNDFTKKGKSTKKIREGEIEKVAEFLKYDDYHIALSGNKYHLRLDTVGQQTLMHIIERESNVSVEKVRPTIVAFPQIHSYNQDHRAAAAAAHAALRPAPNHHKHFVPTVLSYESPADIWTTQALPPVNFFLPLTQTDLLTKTKALSFYSSQDRPFPNLRSKDALTALARLRGGTCGREYAEGFLAHRVIV